jgi:hypothetical protein
MGNHGVEPSSSPRHAPSSLGGSQRPESFRENKPWLCAKAIRVDELLGELESNPAFQILPFTVDIAAEVAALGKYLRDPADRAIVSTARVRKLRLVTSDQHIVGSKLVPVIA